MATAEEAIDVLSQLGFPRQQRNERSALTLLALLDLTPDRAWSEAAAPLRGITQLMDFMAEHYGKQYAPNTRETVRRQTVHQFLSAGLVVLNPDEPERPINSGKTVYQVSPPSLRLLRAYKTVDWAVELINYQHRIESLAERWALERDLQRIPVTLPEGQQVSLSPGGQNELVARILEDFCPLFTRGGAVLYIGDADEKFAIHDQGRLENLGILLDEHGKMPDLVIHDVDRDWLVLIEAVTSHGPVNPKRREELRDLFSASSAGLVFVTAFEDRRTLAKYVAEISWETEVWVAEDPTHLIHFDGERFLGPYGE
ncbi:MAG: BsuBI/PstI family type II restriction endonuclease [bacterium]|nr:BsuBI/PstI family type II restriction endonuclease [bacterium]